MNYRRLLIALLTCLALIFPTAALGQADYRLPLVTVSFWPEFDRPQVLVIYQAEIPEDVTLPALVELPLPQDVEAPHAVATATETGSLVNATFETIDTENGQLLQVTAETRTVWVEYYQDLSFDGDQRSFQYQWPGTMAVDEFNFEVQQPVGARSLELDPAADGQRVGADGLTYQTGSFGSVDQGQSVSLEFNYQKDTDELTAGEQPAQPLEGVSIDPPETVSRTTPSWLVGGLIGLGLALVVTGGYWLWRRQNPPKPSKRRRRRRDRKQQPAQDRYCHQCGQSVGAGDRFCRHCGAEQRVS